MPWYLDNNHECMVRPGNQSLVVAMGASRIPKDEKIATSAKKNQGDAMFFGISGILHHVHAPEGQTVTKDETLVLR